jgi:transcriptional regulator with XRE-family HTH domain
VARKKRKVSPKVQERVSDRLDQLQTIYSQKELASKLGVSERSIRNYQNGTSSPDKKTRDKLNQIFRSKKDQITEEKVSKRKKKKENKRAGKKKADEKKARAPHLITTDKFASQFKEWGYIQEGIISEGGEYVAVTDGNKAQFVTGEEIMLGRYGRPKGTKYVEIIGVYVNQYEHDDDLSNGDFQVNRLPTLWSLTKEIELGDFLDQLEGKFMETERNQGKFKWSPVLFIGYRLV